MDKKTQDRFWAKVKFTDDCWLWTGEIRKEKYQGYGVFYIKNKKVPAHRAAWMMTHGDIPEGRMIDHVCHVQNCVNPLHLRLATPSENSRNALRCHNNTAGHKGVTFHGGKFRVRIRVMDYRVCVGTFDTIEDASDAYDKAAEFFHKEYACFG